MTFGPSIKASARRRMSLGLAGVCLAASGVAVGGFAESGNAWAKAQSRSTSYQLGVNVQFYDWGYSSSQLTSDATAVFKYVKALHANSVAITIPFLLPSLTTNDVGPGPWTPSAARVGTVVKIAEGVGLHVMLRPIVDETNLRPSWRGAFSPADPSKWFQNYLLFLKPYLLMAQQDKVTTFDVGTELQGTYRNSLWSSLITISSDWYKGTIEVSGSWGNGNTIAMKGTTSGIDAYLPVAAPPTASVATLLAGWNQNLAKKPFPLPGKVTTITEVGIAAQDGAYSAPNNPKIGTKTPVDDKIQTNWFTAACQFVKQHSLKGIYYWRLDLGSPVSAKPTTGNPTLFAPSTVSEIKTCFSKTL
jgi:hypothetical protein